MNDYQKNQGTCNLCKRDRLLTHLPPPHLPLCGFCETIAQAGILLARYDASDPEALDLARQQGWDRIALTNLFEQAILDSDLPLDEVRGLLADYIKRTNNPTPNPLWQRGGETVEPHWCGDYRARPKEKLTENGG